MYVEVSARNTGKTTRLIDSIIEYLTNNPENTSLLVTPNQVMRRKVIKQIDQKCGPNCYGRVIGSYRMIPSPRGSMKNFVDEYGLINEKYLLLDENAYYTTTTLSSDKSREIYDHYKNNYLVLGGKKVIKKFDF